MAGLASSASSHAPIGARSRFLRSTAARAPWIKILRRYAACFIGAMKFVSSQGGPKVPQDTSVTASVGIGPRSEGGFGLVVGLSISLPGLPSAAAHALVEKAHQVCPYSNATRNNVDVKLEVT